MSKLRICLVSSEVAPFAKTGGLADVVAGLARWLGRQGHDVRVFMPRYANLRVPAGVELEDAGFGTVNVEFDGTSTQFRVVHATLPDSDVPVMFVDCPTMFGREQLYSSTYSDEHVRFGLLCRATLESCQRMQWGPDVFHLNDWHTALLPLYLKTLYAWDELFDGAKTVLTIHNIGFQGQFGPGVIHDLGMDSVRKYFHQEDLAHGHVNFLKTGILYADVVTTVSQTYAREIQTEAFGMGLADVLSQRAGSLAGIVNAVDYDEWNPETDARIPANYSLRDLAGKVKCKQALLERFDLQYDVRTPVFGVVSRLTGQKGFDLMPDALPVLLHEEEIQLVVLGSGEERYEQYFQWLRDRFPDRVAVYRGYHEELAHWIEAGADAFLMPSHYEPCGMNQMYSLRYGTVPVVRRTGGLADTVRQFDPRTGEGTGYLFDEYDAGELVRACRRLLRVWPDRPTWSVLVRNGMQEDFSWNREGPRYVELYEQLKSSHGGRATARGGE